MSDAAAAVPDEVVIDYKEREAWLERRARGIGGSEAAAIYDVGVSPFESPFSLWAAKARTDRPPPPLEGEILEWGALLEPAVAKRYEAVTGRQLWAASPYAIAEHPRVSCMFATPDRYVITAPDRPGRGQLQIKTTGAYMEEHWKETPPQHVQIQVQHELAVTGRDWSSLAVLIGGNKFRFWDIERNENFIREHELQCELFWQRVLAKDPPPADGHEATFRALARLHPLDNGETVDLPDVAKGWWDRFDELNAQISVLRKEIKLREKEQEPLEAKLKQAIGDNTFGRLPDGRLLTLPHTSRKGYTVEPCTYRTLKLAKVPGERKAPKKTAG